MARLAGLTTTICFSVHCLITAAQAPPDFPGTVTPYQVIPTGTDAPTPTDTATPANLVGTYLYGYIDCQKNFGNGAKTKIDDAYYDAWLISK